MLGLGVGGVDLHNAAVFGMDLLPGVHRPGDGIMLRLAQAGVLHHVLGRLVDLRGVLLIRGEDAHPRSGLPVPEQMLQAEAGGKLGLSIFLRQLVVKETAVTDPGAVLILGLHPVKLGDGVHFPGLKLKGLSCPLVLAVAQQAEKVHRVLHGLGAVAQLRSVVRDGHFYARGQGKHLRHGASAPASSAQMGSPPAPFHPRQAAAPGGTGW